MPASPQAPTMLRLASLVGFMWGAYFLNYSDRQAVFAMFKPLSSDLAMTDQQLGLTGAVFLWVYGIGCPLAGQLADRVSKRLLVVLSLALWSVVTLAMGLATSGLMLLALRAAMGVSESLYMPAAISLTADSTPPSLRSRAVALLTTAQIAGTVCGSWFGGWMAERGQWRGAFFALGAVGLVYALPYFAFLRGFPETTAATDGDRPPKLSVAVLARVPTYALLCVTFPVFVFGLWLLYSWLPEYLREKFSLGIADAAFTATAYMQTATLVGLLLGGVLADRLFAWTRAARIWLLVASFLGCAPCLHLIGACQSLPAMTASLIGFGLASGFLMGNIFPAAFEVVPASTRASAVGVLNLFAAVISGFAPLLGGMWRRTIGLERLMDYTSIAYLVGALLLVVAILRFFPRDYARAQDTLPGTDA